MLMNQALLSSKKMNWRTPDDFYNKLNDEFHFVGDMASDDNNAKCKFHYTKENSGLEHSWNLGGWVFCNPPYGRELKQWVKKAYDEWKDGAKIVMLIPARTDTSYFHDYIYDKAEIRFLRGRIKFCDDNNVPSNPAPFPSMLVIYK